MAESLAHRWGQIIGEVFEIFVQRVMNDAATRHGLYLDSKRPRRARAQQGGRDLSKVTWQDGYGNKHDLDYVLERGGTEDAFGVPVAFIESAWRRYTKHSKNKAQEIEAAVLPVAATFSRHQPFCGAFLAGEFTRNAVQQLESKGFVILHIPYASILAGFASIGIDASSVDGTNGTTEDEFRAKIAQWQRASQPAILDEVIQHVRQLHAAEVTAFVAKLDASLGRQVITIRLTVLRGHSVECASVGAAIEYLVEEERSSRIREDGDPREFFEVIVRFNTGAKIEAAFPQRAEAIAFLNTFALA